MYTKCGGVAAYHVVCIGLCLWSVRVCVFLLVLWTTDDYESVGVLEFLSEFKSKHPSSSKSQ